MANISSLALDETVHNRPDIVQWWAQEMGGQPASNESLDENLIYRYVCESVFFDWKSKNGLLFQQAQANLDQWQLTLRRKSIEDFLKTKPGVEFTIVDGPVADRTKPGQGVQTGVWIIRKQLRERAKDSLSAKPPGVTVENGWELTTLATYFLVGQNMYQAPSVGDIIGNRLLAASASLSKFVEIAHGLPQFTPSTGYRYLPMTTKPSNAASTSETPSRSREGSVVPGTETQSLRSGSALPEPHLNLAVSSTEIKDARLLQSALMSSLQFGDEYMDENPLQGEPGNFSFTSTAAAIKKRRLDEEAAVARVRADKESATTSRVASPKVEELPSPPAVFTDAKTAVLKAERAEKAERRGSKMGEKARRRKSRPAGATPSTPTSATVAPLSN